LDDVDKIFKSYFTHWLLDWIAKNVDSKYEKEEAFWYHDFISVTNSDQAAVDLFFKTSKEFFDDYKNKRIPK